MGWWDMAQRERREMVDITKIVKQLPQLTGGALSVTESKGKLNYQVGGNPLADRIFISDDAQLWGEPTQPSQAVRKDAGKTRIDLIDWEFVNLTADVLAFGAIKYAPNGWRKGMAITRCLGSMFRHMIAFAMGQDADPESGLSHLGHIGCNLMFIAAYMKRNPELDDRVKVMG